MTDPAEVAQQMQQAQDIATGVVGGAGGLAGAGLLARGVAKLLGTWRKARAADVQSAADEWQELHAECKRETAALHDRLDALEARMQQEHAPCRAVEAAQQRQIDELRHEVSVMQRAIVGLLEATPKIAHTPDDVRRGVEGAGRG